MWPSPSLCYVSLLVACAAWSISRTDARQWHDPTEHWMLVLVFFACVLRFAWLRLRFKHGDTRTETEATNQAEAILAANSPLAKRLVEGVLLSSDLTPLLLAPLQLEDGAAAAVCSLWAEGWKTTSEGRRRLTRVAFDFPADVLATFVSMAAIPGDDEKLVVCSDTTVTILDRSMSIVTSFIDVVTKCDNEVTGYIVADEQSLYISTVNNGQHQRLTHDGIELASYDIGEDPDGFDYEGHCPVLAPGGLLFCVHLVYDDEADDWDEFEQHETWDEIIALDAHSMQLRYRFGKSLLNGACGLAVVGEELFVCDKLNDRLQVFSLAGEHRRSITGEWKQPSSLCVMKDRLYLVEKRPYPREYGPSPYEDKQIPGRRIFVLSLQGETLQVYPVPAHNPNSFSRGDLCCFDGKLLVPMFYVWDPLDVVALLPLPLARPRF